MQDLCNQHRWYRKKSSIIGRGEQAIIYQACSNQQKQNKSPRCNFVVKELASGISPMIDELAAAHGIGPPVYIEICNDIVYLIEERLDGTLQQLLENGYQLSEEDEGALSQLIYNSIDLLHIFHGDTHYANIMYKIIGGSIRFYLIDFSNAQLIDETMGSKRFDLLLIQHSYVPLDDRELQVLSDEQMEALKTKYRPTIQQTPYQIQKAAKRAAKLKQARQNAKKQLAAKIQARTEF
jgi:thiamine kinase-like enzyme